MQVYLVGGAVRDELLGLPVHERDWVVVGATPEIMERQGYRPAGRDFPVYLHPQSHEEYALARLERKVGPGYRGFRTEFSPDVTLEEDLRRRDLTINAMARSADGRLIDPYGGQADLQARVLRHVSDAFVEDPVRILRVARFAARLARLGFHVAAQTRDLMARMVAQGEVNALVHERVWKELERALREADPARCFEVLNDCGALRVLAPQLLPLFAAEGHGSAVLAAAAALGAAATVRWAALLAGLGAAVADELCGQLHAPLEFRELAVLAARLDSLVVPGARAPSEPTWLLSVYESADAFRRPARFQLWLQVLAARAQAAGIASADSSALQARLQSGLAAAAAVHLSAQELPGLRGPAIGARLHALRLAAIDRA